jgi:replicative DNA helicase
MRAMQPLDDAHGAWRLEPMNIEAEQALLGAMLINNNAHECVSNFLEPHHFLTRFKMSFGEKRGRIYWVSDLVEFHASLEQQLRQPE